MAGQPRISRAVVDPAREAPCVHSRQRDSIHSEMTIWTDNLNVHAAVRMYSSSFSARTPGGSSLR